MTQLSFKARLKALIERPDGATSTSFLEEKGRHPYDLQRFCELYPSTGSVPDWAKQLNKEGNEFGTGWDRYRNLLRDIVKVCPHNGPTPRAIFHYVHARRVRESLIKWLIEDLQSTDLDNIRSTAPDETIGIAPEPFVPPPEEPKAPEPRTPELPAVPKPVRRSRQQPRPTTPHYPLPGGERSNPTALAMVIMDRGQHHIQDDPEASGIMQREGHLLIDLYHRTAPCEDDSEERLRQILKFPDELQGTIDYSNERERAAWYTQAILDTQLKHLSKHKPRGGL